MTTNEAFHPARPGPWVRARSMQWIGASLLLAMAAIDLLVYVGEGLAFEYPGVLFLLDAAAAVVIAAGFICAPRLAWHLGALLTATTIALFVVVHTIGLPAFQLGDWLEVVAFLPLGPLSLAVEAAFLVTYAIARTA